ncbi:hypothetical protein [Treponema pectinovorum]|uniref:hypothetical protein n=1 Tax=Treponema pectinovorum TaxID=164 RepID=UPI0011C87579|nr:hypothetical protein [Treponema pectinovorum]
MKKVGDEKYKNATYVSENERWLCFLALLETDDREIFDYCYTVLTKGYGSTKKTESYITRLIFTEKKQRKRERKKKT